MSNLRNKAKENHHYFFGEWVLSILVCLLCGALVLSGLIDTIFIYLLFPFLIAPILFLAHTICLSFKYGGELSFKSFFKNFLLFFKNPNYGSFNILSSFFRSLLIYLVSFIFMGVLGVIITKNVYPLEFDKLLETVEQILLDSTLIYENELSELFKDCLDAYNLYLYLVSVPSLLIQWGFFIYYISKSSISIYFRLSLSNVPSQFVRRMVNRVFYRNRQLVIDYFSLNFPLFIIYAFVAIAGFVIGLFYYQEANILAFILVAFFVLFIFFMPFYIANMETLFNEYEPMFKEAFINVSKEAFARFENDPSLNENEKEQLRAALKKDEKEDDDEIK